MRIQEMAAESGLTTYALRFYERKGLVTPKRDARGDRDYSPVEQSAVHRIAMYRRAGLSVEEIKAIFTGMPTTEMITLLRTTRDKTIAQRQAMDETIAYLGEKIAHEEGRLKDGGQHIPTPSEDVDNDGLADN
ncbi:hypothetical protein AYR62_12035 [Secundilactobacillus paracollinoides]|uniref:HTH merR-type domain-containing protein n=1 Tax=Secundilactobacillus paracollinoides TaxID=240427 RepID=A0A1B2IXP7_9LACO|nr:MerR family transcriptional regulator [Secundilactobacillus paracollinoides]ANZ60919.1 hypothetical protein AYR61_05910 [Secundilactobacillus paracollinoides]ANZ64734.1 hypothetical protein AYR62_12035 [Secundilactobacillus paracollinoides]ANZ66778.1 hypothetical protein AYR63_06280 [Secundilactobacillus paracollinoides]KRL80717.1 MerR family transcriptional regulator [Secundilactobacillus paracollinoides DSM 15502 = JCM 11969]